MVGWVGVGENEERISFVGLHNLIIILQFLGQELNYVTHAARKDLREVLATVGLRCCKGGPGITDGLRALSCVAHNLVVVSYDQGACRGRVNTFAEYHLACPSWVNSRRAERA